ncbi:uncharacterized protein LOC114520154 [Dendronephthya gigantea]|uniref:uncharacterized protein LOC114520154 n=1 Tax=Dendronephthya gigantea TaxID=151771 RepID=UPI00106D8415|nr:uncharacterized protein LOC114520154 [Dendronephthya gigantea]
MAECPDNSKEQERSKASDDEEDDVAAQFSQVVKPDNNWNLLPKTDSQPRVDHRCSKKEGRTNESEKRNFKSEYRCGRDGQENDKEERHHSGSLNVHHEEGDLVHPDDTIRSLGSHNLRSTPQQSTKVDFYLLIPETYSVANVCIHAGRHWGELFECEQPNLWKCSLDLPGDPIKNRFKYSYSLYRKKHTFKIPGIGRVDLGNVLHCKESAERCVGSQVQYDVFHFPEDRTYINKTIPSAVIFYLKWLLPHVNQLSISGILAQIKTLQFGWLNMEHTKHCATWIVQETLGNSVSDTQRLYLCIVLAHLQNISSLFSRSNNQTAEVCDRFLQCLNACADSNYLSKTDLQLLKKVAGILVENSSSPGWLTLAAHFYPYLGIKFLLSERYNSGLNYIYDVMEYHKIVDALFKYTRTLNNIEQPAHQRLLRCVLMDAPTLNDAITQFERCELRPFFADEHEKVDFFVKFYEENSRHQGTRDESIGAELVHFFELPDTIREKLHTLLYDILLKISMSVDQLQKKHEKMFLEAMRTLGMNEVHVVLKKLSTSKSVNGQRLVLEILNKKNFEEKWLRTPQAIKVEICKSWVIARVKNKASADNLSGEDKVVAVYEAFHIIMHCSLNISNESLAEEISTSAVEMVLKNEDAICVLKAFPIIENYVDVVQNCYKSHVEMVLQQAPSVIRKSTVFLNECSRSDRYTIRTFFSFSYCLLFPTTHHEPFDSLGFLRSDLALISQSALGYPTTNPFQHLIDYIFCYSL